MQLYHARTDINAELLLHSIDHRIAVRDPEVLLGGVHVADDGEYVEDTGEEQRRDQKGGGGRDARPALRGAVQLRKLPVRRAWSLQEGGWDDEEDDTARGQV